MHLRYSEPNMIGSFDGYLDFITAEGACSTENYSNTIPVLDRGVQGNHGIGIDAAKSSVVYGASDTVQPNSLRALALIRAF